MSRKVNTQRTDLTRQAVIIGSHKEIIKPLMVAEEVIIKALKYMMTTTVMVIRARPGIMDLSRVIWVREVAKLPIKIISIKETTKVLKTEGMTRDATETGVKWADPKWIPRKEPSWSTK
jgi:hypothetical protein